MGGVGSHVRQSLGLPAVSIVSAASEGYRPARSRATPLGGALSWASELGPLLTGHANADQRRGECSTGLHAPVGTLGAEQHGVAELDEGAGGLVACW